MYFSVDQDTVYKIHDQNFSSLSQLLSSKLCAPHTAKQLAGM